jgi:hypothetical protein
MSAASATITWRLRRSVRTTAQRITPAPSRSREMRFTVPKTVEHSSERSLVGWFSSIDRYSEDASRAV